MKTNKLDKNIKEKFENRTFEPSASAWERLSVQLDEQPKQKKFGWFFYISAAASILLLVTIGLKVLSKDSEISKPTNEIVNSTIDKKVIDQNIEELMNNVQVLDAVVKNEEVNTAKEIVHDPVIANYKKETNNGKKLNDNNFNNQKNESTIAEVEKIKRQSIQKDKSINQYATKDYLKQNLNSTIKIDAGDLLFAVTHTPKEVKAYYAKYNLNREDVLRTIKSELKKSNLKVNPNTILAEVERNIEDEYFENNFMKSLKKRVSTIAVAIASRND